MDSDGDQISGPELEPCPSDTRREQSQSPLEAGTAQQDQQRRNESKTGDESDDSLDDWLAAWKLPKRPDQPDPPAQSTIPTTPQAVTPEPATAEDPGAAVTVPGTDPGQDANPPGETVPEATEPVTPTVTALERRDTPVTGPAPDLGLPQQEPANTVTDTATSGTPDVVPPEDRDARVTEPVTKTADQKGGRMAAEVTYDSVMEESDELSLMCQADFETYQRIKERCQREISKGEELIAELQASDPNGVTIPRWVATGIEKYRTIHALMDTLMADTIGQYEAVVQAKALLEAGQGVYAAEAANMESVGERDFYLEDHVDSDDLAADTETFETSGARS
jgi:hypothetical protein